MKGAMELSTLLVHLFDDLQKEHEEVLLGFSISRRDMKILIGSRRSIPYHLMKALEIKLREHHEFHLIEGWDDEYFIIRNARLKREIRESIPKEVIQKHAEPLSPDYVESKE